MQHPYQRRELQERILRDGSRDAIIAWLAWNDRNGVYTDEASEADGLPPLTLESARTLMREILDRG